MRSPTVLSFALAAGAALGASEPLTPFHAGDIYYNVATGERVVTPPGSGARTVSGPIWENVFLNSCRIRLDYLLLDNPDFDGDTLPDYEGLYALPPELGAPTEGSWVVDWADLQFDSVVDCVRIAYATSTPDTDADSNSIGDGVVGFDMTINFSDADNGRDSDRACIYQITIETLPGAVPGLPPNSVPFYVLTLDFGTYAPSQVFELGDSDNIDQAGTGFSGGAIYGAPTGADLDGDMRNDFSVGVTFDQSALPLASRGLAGIVTATPDEENAPGSEDAFDLYDSGPSCSPGEGTFLGTFNYGGESCEPGFEIPYSQMWLGLYGPGSVFNPCLEDGACSQADFAPPAGVLDFSDVIEFLVEFSQNSVCADMAPPFVRWDFSDILAFLSTFAQGCP